MLNQVGSINGMGTKAQVRNGDGSGFLRIIVEKALGIIGGLFTDDFDRVLVGTHCTI